MVDSVVIEEYVPEFFQAFKAWGYQARVSSAIQPVIQVHSHFVAGKYPVHVYQDHKDVQFWTEQNPTSADLSIRNMLKFLIKKDSVLCGLPLEDRTLGDVPSLDTDARKI